MFITELFDKPVQLKNEEYDQDEVSVEFDVEGVPYKFYAHTAYNNPTAWEIEFSARGTTKIINTGNEIKVFSTVVQIMQNMLKLYNIETLYFTAEEPSRQKLYNRLVDRLLPTWYKSFSEYGTFTVSKPKGR
jgi:hypothetical protein